MLPQAKLEHAFGLAVTGFIMVLEGIMKQRKLVLAALLLAMTVLALPASYASRQTVAQPSLFDGMPDHAVQTQVQSALHSTPLMFIENVGQFDEGARFLVRGGQGAVWLTEEGLWITLLEPVPPQTGKRGWEIPGVAEEEDPLRLLERADTSPRQGVHLKLSFVNANPVPRLETFEPMETSVNYFLGNDPARWRSNAPVWGGVRYVDLYPGLDLEIAGEAGTVRPQVVCKLADCQSALQAVRLQVEGADDLVIEDGLHLATTLGDFTLPLFPVVVADGSTAASLPLVPHLVGNAVLAPFASSFAGSLTSSPSDPLGQDYERLLTFSSTTVQDNPADLLYSTFLGGNMGDAASAVTVDEAGQAYVTGTTYSLDFPTTPGAFDTSHNDGIDVFVVKLNATGTALLYSTFLGGSDRDETSGIAVDGSGQVYVTGFTYSLDFPTTSGAFDTSHNGGNTDAFVTKLNAAGSALIYSTFLGGGSEEIGNGIVVDEAGQAYVTGRTGSADFPTTPEAFDTSHNGLGGRTDVFVTKLNGAGSGLVYSTFLGASNSDVGQGIAVDESGQAYVTGYTRYNFVGTPPFPTTPGAFDTTFNGYIDVFVTKLNAAGSGLVYSTFLGGNGVDQGHAIAVDGDGQVHVTGYTMSGNFPTTPGAFDTGYNGSSDAFVTKLNAAGSALLYSTFLGGSNGELGHAITVDGAGMANVTGYTLSVEFPTTPGAFDSSYNGMRDAFVTKLNVAGSALLYSTFLGGSSEDVGYGIATSGADQVYVTGFTLSSSFPVTPGAFDISYNGNSDAFITKLAMGGSGITYTASGRVTDDGGSGINGAVLSTNIGHSATTNANGDYTITGLITGTYTIIPAKAGYTFSPVSRTVTVPPDAAGQNFTGFSATSGISISHIEVTQVIQDENNYVPLIAGKPTFVRVYVDCGSGCTAVPGVTGTLEVSSSAGTATYQPDMGTITAEHPPTPPGWISQRGDLRKTLNFYRISTDLLTGNVTFTAQVGNATESTELPFVPGKRLRIAWVPVRYQPFWPLPPVYSPDETIAARAGGFMGKIFPLAGADLDYFQQPLQPTEQGFLTFSNSFTRFTAWNQYLPKLDQLWQIISSQAGWLGGEPVDRLYGWVPVEAPPLLTPDIAGMAYATWYSQQGHSGSGRVAAGIDGDWPGLPRSNVLLAHEIGHLLNDTGLYHAACGTEGIPNLPGGRIDNWGIDFIGRPPTLYSPAPMHSNVAYDFMSYCTPAWVSTYHYRRLEEGFQDYSAVTQSLSTSHRVLSVLGTIYTPTHTVDFGTFYPLDSIIPADASRGNDYCLELRNADEALLDSRCFDLSFTLPESGEPTDAESFTLLLPYPEAASALVLTYKGSELDRVSKSNNAPAVQLLSPNGGEVWSASGTYTVTWTASDADGDPLRFMVSYSDDDGATWMPLALDITDNYLAVDSANIPGSSTARFKVTATDQMLTGEDVSDASFTVGSKGPAAFILLPEREGTIPPGLPLYLQGYAYDLEDGTLRDNSLQWSSSIDGDLGNGQTILAMLSPGAHIITLTATDSDGNQGAATLDLYVGYKLYLPVIRR
jgi:hypothetical protein